MAANIEDILKRLRTMQDSTTDGRVKEQLPAVIKDLTEFAQNQETERNKLQEAVNHLQTTLASLRQANAEQAKQIDDLKQKLENASNKSSATPLGLATSFKSVMDSIQSEARKTPGVATTVKSMDIEVKGLVQVQDKETVLVLPGLNSSIDANALSTLRVSFGAIPVAVSESASPTPSSPDVPRSAAPPQQAPESEAWSMKSERPFNAMKPMKFKKKPAPKA